MNETVTHASDELGKGKEIKSIQSWMHNLASALATDPVFSYEVGTPHLYNRVIGSHRISFAVAAPNRIIVASPPKTRLGQ